MKNLVGDFNAKVGREDTFKPISSNESPHEASNDNGVSSTFAISKNLFVKCKTFPHRDIKKRTWTTSDVVTHSQIMC
jgi:hypothetical protein